MNSILTLLPKLIRATEAGKLAWEPASGEERYRATIANRSLYTWNWLDDDTGSSGYSAQICNISGTSIIDVAAADKYSDDHEQLERLFSAARRSALNVDQVVDEIDEALDALEIRSVFD